MNKPKITSPYRKDDSILALAVASRLVLNVLWVGLIALTLLSFLFLAGCAAQSTSSTSSDGYQFGDGFDALMARQQEYCATANPARRAVLLAVIRSQVPMYPASGLCSDAEQALAEELARQAAGLPPVDMEQAVEDQRRAQERLEQE